MITLVLILLLGLALGSFINAFVWRLKTNKNWVSERSICPHCKHVLAPADLVPVMSWMLLGGKCRYCKKPISKQYPLVELVTGLLFALSYLFWPYSLSSWGVLSYGVWLACLVLLMALFVYDAKWMLLPNVLVAPLTGLSLFFAAGRAFDKGNPRELLYAVASAGVFFFIFWLLFQISGGKWIGGGDVKLALSLGLLVGTIPKVFLVIFLASMIGTIYVLPQIVSQRVTPKSKLAFGPLLIIATYIVFLSGDALISWYTDRILYL